MQALSFSHKLCENWDQIPTDRKRTNISRKLCENWAPSLGAIMFFFWVDSKIPPRCFYYLRATARFGWSRNVLLNQIKAKAYERAVTEKKTHNFPLALPEHLAEQADEMLKSSYNLEFLGIRRAGQGARTGRPTHRTAAGISSSNSATASALSAVSTG